MHNPFTPLFGTRIVSPMHINRKSKFLAAAQVALALALAFGPSALHAQSSLRMTHLVQLGSLSSWGSSARGINSSGQIVGDSFLPDGSPSGFIFEDSMRSLGLVAGYICSNAMAINDAGTAVGSVYAHAPGFEARAYSEAAVFRNGGISLLGTLSAIDPDLPFGNGFVFSPSSDATAITNAGLVAGNSNRGTDPLTWFGSPTHAVTFSGGAVHDLGTLGGETSIANGINNLGQVVGWAHTDSGQVRAFLHTNGSMVVIMGAPSIATAINDQGQIVGVYANRGQEEAFLYTNGAVRGLGRLGDAFSEATGLNELGQVVGYFKTTSDSPNAAFMFSDGVRYTLDSLTSSFLAQGQGAGLLSLTKAYGINDAGLIVGEGEFRDSAGGEHTRAFAAQVKRVTFIWEGSEGFSFDNANNWSDLYAPEAPDTVLLSELGSKRINLAGQTVRTDRLLALSGSDTTIDLGGGSWEVGAGAAASDLQGRFRITGGTVSLSQGTLEVFDNVIIRNDGFGKSVLRIDNGGILRASGNAMIVGATGALFESEVDIRQNGTLILDGSTLIIGSEGPGSMRVNNGTVLLARSLYVGADAPGSLLLQGPETTFSMPLNAGGGGGGEALAAHSQAVQATGSSTFGEVYVGLRQQGSVTVDSDATMNFGNALVLIGNDRVDDDPSVLGTLTVQGGSSQVLGGLVKVRGTGLLVIRDTAEFHTTHSLDIMDGSVFVQSGGHLYASNIFVNLGALNVDDNGFAGTHKLQVFGGSVTLSGGGQLYAVAPGGAGTAHIAGGLLDIGLDSTLISDHLTLGRSARVTGRGKIIGTVINEGASIEPGQSPGVLSIEGDFQQLDGSLVLEIGGTTVGTEHDQLRVSGNFMLEGGVVEMRFIGGFAPSSGDQFALLHVGGSLVNAGSFTVSGLLPGWQYSTTFDVASQQLRLTSLSDGVSAVPEPGTGALMLGGVGLLGWGRRRSANPQ